MAHANSLFAACGTTIFETMSRLANQHGAVNLGQGFPEGLEPAALVERLAQCDRAGPHQYPSMMGTPSLRAAVAAHERHYWGIDAAADEVMVTSGATEALAACFFGLIEPGDEVALIEPLYDSYLPIIRRAGGIPRLVRVEPPHWTLPREALAAAFGPRTRLLVLNSPTNPCGKVYDADELAFIAELLERHDAVAVCDEVYEHLTFDGRRHVPLASLPGLRRRTVKVGSAGKIFSLTGWKVGWVVAEAELLAPIAKAHQYLTFTTAPALQEAVAWGLEHQREYLEGLAGVLQGRRDRLAAGLEAAGFAVLPTGGSYFLTADFRPLGFAGGDAAFCRHITERAGVAAIPVSAFYQGAALGAVDEGAALGAVDEGAALGAVDEGPAPGHFARFCFAKTDDAIDRAVERLGKFFS